MGIRERDEENTVVELADTKHIQGVTCIVMNDLVVMKTESTEDTNYWFGQRKDGTVDSCGEESKDLEIFEGDNPMIPELVSIDGSFKAGRDGDLPARSPSGYPPRAPLTDRNFRLGTPKMLRQCYQ